MTSNDPTRSLKVILIPIPRSQNDSLTFLFRTSAQQADWEEIEFTAAHCGIENEMTVKECDLVTCK